MCFESNTFNKLILLLALASSCKALMGTRRKNVKLNEASPIAKCEPTFNRGDWSQNNAMTLA